MAKQCPQCKRPNGDDALRCLYCGQTLPSAPAAAVSPQAAPAASSSPSPATKAARSESYMVTISPRQGVDDKSITVLARELALDSYMTKQKLLQPAPWIARTFKDGKDAQEMVKRLAAFGLDTYVVKRGGIEKLNNRVQVMGVKTIGESEIEFLDEGGKPVSLALNNIFLLVRGRIRERPDRATSITEDQPVVRIGKSADGKSEEGAMGVIRDVIERVEIRPSFRFMSWSGRTSATEAIDIYKKDSSVSIRMLEGEFDYSGLGAEMSPSGLINYYLIVNRILDGARGCIVDDSFNLVGYTFNEGKEDKVKLDLAAQLGGNESRKKLYDNRAFFNDHSSRVYLHYLREFRKPKD